MQLRVKINKNNKQIKWQLILLFLLFLIYPAVVFSQDLPVCTEQEIQRYGSLLLCQTCKQYPNSVVCQNSNVTTPGQQTGVDLGSFYNTVLSQSTKRVYYVCKDLQNRKSCFPVLADPQSRPPDSYDDINQCVNACKQSLPSFPPVYHCSLTGQIYSDLATCNDACIQTVNCIQRYTVCDIGVNCAYYRVTSFVCYPSVFVCLLWQQISPGSSYREGSCSVTVDNDCVVTSFSYGGSPIYVYVPPGQIYRLPSPCRCSFSGSVFCCTVTNNSTPTSTICPFPDGSACSGDPPTCTRRQSCTVIR